MADGAEADPGSGGLTFTTDEVTYSGDTMHAPINRFVHITGAEGAKTIHEVWFAEDAAHTTGDYGLQFLAVRSDTLAAIAGTTGDYTPLQVNASGALYIQEGSALDVSGATVTVDNGGTFATQIDGDALTALQLIDDVIYADDADWTDGTSKHALVGGLYQSTPQSITDGDVGPLQVTANGYAIVSVNGTVTVAAHDVTNAGTFAVQEDGAALTALQLIDNIVQVEDAVHGTGDSGVMSLAVRSDTLAALADTDGDYAPLQVDVDGALYSTPATQTATGSLTGVGQAVTITLKGEANVSFQVAGTFVGTVTFESSNDNTNWHAIWGYQAGATTIVQSTTGGGIFRLTTAGFAYVRVRCSLYTSGTIDVTGVASHGTSGVFTNLPSYGAQQLGKQEDTIHAGGDVGIMALAVRNDTLGTLVDTDGDYAPAQVNASGALYVDGSDVTQPISAASLPLPTGAATAANQLPDGHNVTIDNASGASAVNIQDGGNVITVDNGGTFAVQAASAGDVAHSGADSGNPVKIGAKAESSLETSTAVADGDRTDLLADIDGQLFSKPHCPYGDIIVERISETTDTSTAFSNFDAGGAGVRNYVTTIIAHNSFGTGTHVDIRDGTSGAVLMTVPLPGNGGAVINLPVPLRQTTANTALAYHVATATSTVYLSLVGFQSPI